MAVALAQVQQAVDIALAPGDGGRGQPAFVRRAVTAFQACTNILAWLDDVVGVEGEVADRAADRIAAIQHRGRAAQDFHALDDFRVDIVALGLRVGAVEETVGDRHTVDLGENPLAVDTADVVAVEATALAGAGHRHTRFVTHQVLDVVDVLAVQLRSGLHADRARHLAHVLGTAGGADGHLLQRDHIVRGLAFEYHIGIADLAKAQPGALQQALERGIWRQSTLYTG